MPPHAKGGARKKAIQARVNDEEKAVIDYVIDELGVSFSEIVREHFISLKKIIDAGKRGNSDDS